MREAEYGRGEEARRRMIAHGTALADRLARSPFIAMLAIDGSLTHSDTSVHNDVDFFVVSRKNRIWECFASCLIEGMRLARKLGKPRSYFCFNYLIDETRVLEELTLDRKSARELLNLHVLLGKDFYRWILDQKPEVRGFATRKTLDRIRQGKGAMAASPERAPSSRNHRVIPAVLYRTARPVIWLTAKLFEYRRKARHPGAKIYSNRGAIRSHYH